MIQQYYERTMDSFGYTRAPYAGIDGIHCIYFSQIWPPELYLVFCINMSGTTGATDAMEHDLLTLTEHMSSTLVFDNVRAAQSLVSILCFMYY